MQSFQMHLRKRLGRGVSLIEAVVALALMATGLLGIVGVQSTLRSNSDIAKQRAEGVRLAQEKIEQVRAFRDMGGAPPSYIGITTTSDTFRPAQSNSYNTTFTRTTTVTPMDTNGSPTSPVPDLQAVPRAKSVSVTVQWPDRTGQTQSVTLHAAVAGIAPALAGSLAVPPYGGESLRLPFNRNRGIPPSAVDIGGNQSAFVPPAVVGNVVWVFDNTSAVVSICALRLASGGLNVDNINCTGAVSARLVSGFVRFSLVPGVPPTAADVQNAPSNRPAALAALAMSVDQTAPTTSTVVCVVDNAIAHLNHSAYVCAVPIASTATGGPNSLWSGALRLEDPTGLFVAGGPYRLCRYRVRPGYTSIGTSLLNQNFLVIAQVYSCPLPPPNPLPNPLPDPQPLWTVTHQPP